MKAYVTSIGENTTELCVYQLQKYGFEVEVLDEEMRWIDKYKEFICLANENCIRVDADCIVNKNIEVFANWVKNDESFNDYYMISFNGWDYYKNNVGVIGITYYSKRCLNILKHKLDLLDPKRPETSAWRLPEIVNKTFNNSLVAGIHGIAQFSTDIKRHIGHKIERKQIGDYDFDLASRIDDLYQRV